MPHKLKKCDRIVARCGLVRWAVNHERHPAICCPLEPDCRPDLLFHRDGGLFDGPDCRAEKVEGRGTRFAGAAGAPHRRRRDTWQRRAVRKSAMISHKCQRTSDLGRLGESGFHEGIRSLERVQDRRRRKNKEAAKPARPAPARGSRASPQSR
jgi:hypothetical protein